MYRNVPPYTSLTEMTWASGPSELSTVAVAAEPEANASAYAPPDSIDASVASSAFRLGFPEREYSNPYHRRQIRIVE